MYFLALLKIPIPLDVLLLMLSISSFQFKFSSIRIPKLFVLETRLKFFPPVLIIGSQSIPTNLCRDPILAYTFLSDMLLIYIDILIYKFRIQRHAKRLLERKRVFRVSLLLLIEAEMSAHTAKRKYA